MRSQRADRQYASDRRKEALATLSLFYETPNLTSGQREELLVRLDPLAREVIYSPEHLLEEPHRVGGSETLMDIATKVRCAMATARQHQWCRRSRDGSTRN